MPGNNMWTEKPGINNILPTDMSPSGACTYTYRYIRIITFIILSLPNISICICTGLILIVINYW